MSIAIWLRHVISHHAATMQPLYKRYSTRLEQISSKAGRIREVLLRSQEFISVEADVMRQLQEMKVLDQRVQEMLAPPQRLAAQQEDASNTKYRVIFYQGTIFLEAVQLSPNSTHSLLWSARKFVSGCCMFTFRFYMLFLIVPCGTSFLTLPEYVLVNLVPISHPRSGLAVLCLTVDHRVLH